ncbi:MAG: D-tyrosyl-tRNA(Tyr) deacylase, partial [Flavobacteriales bacterium]|nr:D-tyrosyl-tRNA(Tyr) deacylase [Flavobacteriales bacterium]
MRIILQRVSEASVTVADKVVGKIGKGFLLLVGVEAEDNQEDVEWMSRKIVSLRIFGDEDGKMNLDLSQVDGNILAVSQFTLHAKYKKGSRPSFIRAAHPN